MQQKIHQLGLNNLIENVDYLQTFDKASDISTLDPDKNTGFIIPDYDGCSSDLVQASKNSKLISLYNNTEFLKYIKEHVRKQIDDENVTQFVLFRGTARHDWATELGNMYKFQGPVHTGSSFIGLLNLWITLHEEFPEVTFFLDGTTVADLQYDYAPGTYYKQCLKALLEQDAKKAEKLSQALMELSVKRLDASKFILLYLIHTSPTASKIKAKITSYFFDDRQDLLTNLPSLKNEWEKKLLLGNIRLYLMHFSCVDNKKPICIDTLHGTVKTVKTEKLHQGAKYAVTAVTSDFKYMSEGAFMNSEEMAIFIEKVNSLPDEQPAMVVSPELKNPQNIAKKETTVTIESGDAFTVNCMEIAGQIQQTFLKYINNEVKGQGLENKRLTLAKKFNALFNEQLNPSYKKTAFTLLCDKLIGINHMATILINNRKNNALPNQDLYALAALRRTALGLMEEYENTKIKTKNPTMTPQEELQLWQYLKECPFVAYHKNPIQLKFPSFLSKKISLLKTTTDTQDEIESKIEALMPKIHPQDTKKTIFIMN